MRRQSAVVLSDADRLTLANPNCTLSLLLLSPPTPCHHVQSEKKLVVTMQHIVWIQQQQQQKGNQKIERKGKSWRVYHCGAETASRETLRRCNPVDGMCM